MLKEDCHVRKPNGTCAWSAEAPEEATETFVELNRRLLKLLDWLDQRYGKAKTLDDPTFSGNTHILKLRSQLEKLRNGYSTGAIHEVDPHNLSGDTSFVEGKGRVIGICLRDPRTNEIHDINTLTFVLIHEATHISIDAIQHPPEFWSAFGALLKEAMDCGIYKYVNYYQQPTMYCGMQIKSTPVVL